MKRKLLNVFRAEAFRYLLFAFSLVLIVWPFLPGEEPIPFEKQLTYLYVLWAMVILLLALISRALGSGKDNAGEDLPFSD